MFRCRVDDIHSIQHKNHDIDRVNSSEFTLEMIIEHVINSIRLVSHHYSKADAFVHGQMHTPSKSLLFCVMKMGTGVEWTVHNHTVSHS